MGCFRPFPAVLFLTLALALALELGFGLPDAPAQAASLGALSPSIPSCLALPGSPQDYRWTWQDDTQGSFRVGQILSAQAEPSTPTSPSRFLVCGQLTSPGHQLGRDLPLTLRLAPSGTAVIQIRLEGPYRFWVRQPAEVSLILRETPSESGRAAPLESPFSAALLSRQILLSTRSFCAALTLAGVGLAYALLAKAVHDFYASGRPTEGPAAAAKPHVLRSLSPIVVTASDYGAASLSNLQIFWFTLIVLGLLSYAWLVTGSILNPSADVLWLLGIASGTKVLSASIGSLRQRLNLDNWNWLVENQLLRPESEIDPTQTARWRDLVLVNGVLDPSRYQLLGFGFLIGLSLLFGNLDVVQSFQIPEFFRALQGLSSGFYLFGKAVSPNDLTELDNRIASLRAASAVQPLSAEDQGYLRRTISAIFGMAALGQGLR